MVLTGGSSDHNVKPGRPWPPVTKIVTGFVLVFGAFRINGFDLLIDPIGWGACLSGLSQLQRSPYDPFARARAVAIVMVCISLVAMVAPGVQAVGIANAAGSLVAVWLVVDAVIRRIRPYGETSRATVLDVSRWAVVGLGALGTLTAYGYAALGPVTLIAWFAALVALLITLHRAARLPYLSTAWDPASAGPAASG